MVRGGRGQASDVQVGFAELVPACIAAAAAAVVARAGWSHGVWRRSNRWLEYNKNWVEINFRTGVATR